MTVRLWNLEDYSLIIELKENNKYIQSVAFSPDGSMFAFLSYTGKNHTVKLWNMNNLKVN